MYIDQQKQKVTFVGDYGVSAYMAEPGEVLTSKLHEGSGQSFGLRSSAVGNDKDGFLVRFGGMYGTKVAITVNGERFVVGVSDLVYGKPLRLREDVEVGLLAEPKRPVVRKTSIVGILGDMVFASEEHKKRVADSTKSYLFMKSAPYQWNFWLQELLRYGMEKEFEKVLDGYSSLNSFVKDVLWKP